MLPRDVIFLEFYYMREVFWRGFVGPALLLRTLLPTAPLTVRAQRHYSTTYMGSRRECSGRVIFWLRCFSACARVYVYVYVCAHVRVCLARACA